MAALLILLLVAFFPSHALGLPALVPSSSSTAVNRVALEEEHGLRRVKWANAAWDFVRKSDCSRAAFAGPDECRAVQAVNRDGVAVYLTDDLLLFTPAQNAQISKTSSRNKKLMARLPDSTLLLPTSSAAASTSSRPKAVAFSSATADDQLGGRQEWQEASSVATDFDGMVVLDPYPGAAFGHLVVVFVVISKLTEPECVVRRGIFLGEHEDCLLNAVSSCSANDGPCPVTFLPLVAVANEQRRFEQGSQQLSCRGDLPGFLSRCRGAVARVAPSPASTSSTTAAVEEAGPRCRLFETCDRAVQIVGGWNAQASAAQDGLSSLRQFYKMLRRNGFPKANIKTFFEDGFDVSQSEFSEFGGVRAATSKSEVKRYIHDVCSCASDSFVVYLNSPALRDGSFLLWDNGDGLAAEEERYRPEELMADLEDCRANRVVVLVDQSYAGKIVEAAEARATSRSNAGVGRSRNNIVVMASGNDEDYSWGAEFTRAWSYAKHQRQCMDDVQKQANKAVAARHSQQATLFDSGNVASASTIFGAPCNLFYTFTAAELQNFYGCQSVSTRVWLEMHAPSPPNSISTGPAVGRSQDQQRSADDSDPSGEVDAA